MSEIDVININNEKVGKTKLSEKVFEVTPKTHLMHEYVCMQLWNKRRGTANTKDRSEVSGSTIKLYKQKGTGRARRGSIKSPLLVGGGITFGPKTKVYYKKMNKKAKKNALYSSLSLKNKEGKLVIVDEFKVEKIKTKNLCEILKKIGIENALIVDEENNNLRLSARNLQNVKYLRHDGLNVLDILKFDKLVITKNSLENIQGKIE